MASVKNVALVGAVTQGVEVVVGGKGQLYPLEQLQAEMRARQAQRKRVGLDPRAALTARQIKNARQMHRKGRSLMAIGRHFGVHVDTARKYVLG